ncbi:hypothetical protein N7453_009109 [Penicillium expansum]|nr:hypothetical protein N7453_009109 [Penicillium expansum]
MAPSSSSIWQWNRCVSIWGNTVTPDDNNGFLGEHAQLTQVNQAALANYQYGKPRIIRLIYRHLQPTGVRGRSQPDAL